MYEILAAQSECEWEFMTHLLAILALMSAWINKITPESSIVHYHSFSTPVSLLCVPHSLPLPLTTVTLMWMGFCRHGPDVRMKGKLCLLYCPIDHWLSCSILIQWNIVKIAVFFRQIYHYGDSYFSSLNNKLQYEPLQLSCHSQGPSQIYRVLQIFNAAPISMLYGHRKLPTIQDHMEGLMFSFRFQVLNLWPAPTVSWCCESCTGESGSILYVGWL